MVIDANSSLIYRNGNLNLSNISAINSRIYYNTDAPDALLV